MLKQMVLDLQKYDRTEIAYKSGVSIHTLNRIMSGQNDNPTIKTVEALRGFIDSKENEK